MSELTDIVGVSVQCTVCGMTKAPVGRSLPISAANGYCTREVGGCKGYDMPPFSGWLFPRERWSESYPDIPMPEPSGCYKRVPRSEDHE